MKKIFQAIFGSPDNMNKIVDGTVRGIDALFYTEEERAATMDARREWLLRYLQATQPQAIARRFIAIVVTLLWAFLILFAVLAFTAQYAMQGGGEATDSTMTIASFIFNVLTDIVAIPFAGIMTFYFATHLFRAYSTDKKE